jgi:arylsulfatase A-like enzyme
VKKYNIVTINPDQLRWDYITPNGHPFVETRHLNRLAAMGTNFTNAFCACPMCGPSRTSAVTGRYPSEHGVRNYAGRMHPEHPNLFEELRRAGYHRALFGKDHITISNSIGVHYDEGEDICIGNMDRHPDYRYSWSSGPLDAGCEWNLTERLTTAGLNYIERRSQTGQPFFVTLNFQDPHPYFAAPPPYDTMFDPEQFSLPENFRREPASGEPRRLSFWRQHSHSLDASEDDFKKAMAMYCGQVRYVDDQVGRVLDKLEELDILNETIVLFWSDHGEFLGDYGVTHKLPVFYDSLVRIPMILWDPGGTIVSGTNENLMEAMDVFAAILDLCGVAQPPGSRAHSPAADGYQPRQDVYAEGGLLIASVDEMSAAVQLKAPHAPCQFGPGAMLRTDRWKLCAHSFDCWELYDLQNDPQECCNLFNVPEVAAVVRELTVRLIQRMMCYGQPPEHLPVPVMQGIGEDGLPVWDTRTVRIMDCAGMTPGLSI